jgi:acetyl-CoA carboxylase carboxyl transferase subunit beta
MTGRRRGFAAVNAPAEEDQEEIGVWESIQLTRRPDRPGVRELLRFAATDVVPLSGTGQGETDAGLSLVLARFSGVPCVVLGQNTASQSDEGPLGPAALRVARRGMRLAAELDLPLVSIIDTPGAALSKEAEEGGLAGEIARCLSDLVTLAAPTVCVLLGQGSGGGAMALLAADRIIAARHAWLSPLPPEGASAIMFGGDVSHAAEMAAAQGVGAVSLRRRGIVDRLVPEYGHAGAEAAAFSRRMGAVLGQEMAVLSAEPAGQRLARRSGRYAI